ncbi:HD domain-containing protein [Pseudoalteromonas sp. C2R02]|uniref:HD domain-containing phosphohydrolase n=1 Tax=Pseudoalteromonas sp. C2R02 TaxID=2841565 RepID=UPI001C08A036|nr:HD domain-containing phosphohydrolase [Pseudoalteromonas sp. C2R02]MBU2970215.1 HD domain-containing protein [Pseudoalteromonas sp. C2R02]
MLVLKNYLLKNFEQLFILIILVSVSSIVYFFPHKLAFLSFFFIPVLMGASYLGTKQAILGAVFSIIMVSVYAFYFPAKFYVDNDSLSLLASISVWGGFLILSGSVVGYLNQQLKQKLLEASKMSSELDDNAELLNKTTTELIEFANKFDQKVAERTSTLEKSKQEIETHKHKIEDALYSTMDAAVVKLMIEKRLRTEKRRISILFCDLVSFTLYSEQRRAEVVITDLNNYLASMESVLLLYKAHIDKYVGDGIMAEFGAPIDYECHALMSVMSALKMQEQLKHDDFPWQMRIGIATGEPIIGLIGHKRQSYTALGDVVNLASRIESLCKPGEVTIDLDTYEEVKQYFEIESIYISEKRLEMSSDLADKINRELVIWHKRETAPQACILAILYEEGGDFDKAKKFYKNAMDLDPENSEIKIKFAELSLESDVVKDVPIKGRKKPSHLYRVISIKNPLYDTEIIPKLLLDMYISEVERLVKYPEDILLPVECLDGSIGYSRVVGFLAYIIADKLNLPDKEKKDILEAGYLSDIGKSIIPHHLLNRRGGLNKVEFSEVIKHPIEGLRKLKSMGYQNHTMLNLIACHHEYFDGSGYPNSLTGADIPLGARIIAISEAYTSLTSWRPYREKWECNAAFSELQKHADNGKFDPELMQIFGHILFENKSDIEITHLTEKVIH